VQRCRASFVHTPSNSVVHRPHSWCENLLPRPSSLSLLSLAQKERSEVGFGHWIALLTRTCASPPDSHKSCTVAVLKRSRAATSRTVRKGPMVAAPNPGRAACTTIAPNDRLSGAFPGDRRLRSPFVTSLIFQQFATIGYALRCIV
jgi:hypothetical protein